MKIFLSSSFVLLLFFQNCGQPIGEIAIDFSLTESSNSSNIEVIDNTNNEVVDDIDNPDLLPTSDSIAMYSYNSDLSGAQILEGVTLERSVVYLFLTNDDNYKNISFYCCKSLSEGHLPVIKDSSKPFIHRLDMNEFSGGTKELYMDASYVDSTSYDEIYAQFTIKEG